MQIYRVYHHPQQGYTSFVSGFNWLAAIFSLLWTLANNLWGPSAMLFLGWSIGLSGVFIARYIDLPMLSLAFLAIAVLMPLWAGMYAMRWQDAYLQKKGYKLISKIRAHSAQAAIATAQKKSQKQSQPSR